MLLHLSRASFWLAALAAAWALVAPGSHETALTVVAGAGVLVALALWRSALWANRRPLAGDAEVAQAVVLTGASLVDAAAAVVRIADEATALEPALRLTAAVLKAELGAREARIHEVIKVDATHARLAEWLPDSPSRATHGTGLRAAPRRIALAGSPLGAAIATGRETADLPRAIVVPIAGDGPVLALIELETVEMAIDEAALASLLELTRLSHRGMARRLAAVQAPAALAPSAESRAHVLVVEDNVVQSETSARMLERLGCCVTTASGMLEGLHALRATQFDLVLMDTHMPGMEAADGAARGLGRLRDRLRGALEPAALRGTVFVALAVPGLQDDAERFRELGFDDCLFKPFRRQHLQAMLDKHVRKQAPVSDPGGAGAAPPAGAVLDPVALARLRELDPKGENQLVERVLKAFQASAARLMPQLDAARDANDRNTVRLVAHTLKSSSASIGAMSLSQLCAEYEAAIRNADSGGGEPDLAAMTAAMTAALDAALRAIRRELERNE